MDLMEQGLVAEKMSAVWRRKEPSKTFGTNPKTILANAKIRTHSTGVESLQCGRGVGYIFHLDQPGVPEQYARMRQEAQEGKLESIDLLAGFRERHEDSDQVGSLAYMVTTANRPESQHTFPKFVDDYDDYFIRSR